MKDHGKLNPAKWPLYLNTEIYVALYDNINKTFWDQFARHNWIKLMTYNN